MYNVPGFQSIFFCFSLHIPFKWIEYTCVIMPKPEHSQSDAVSENCREATS